MGHRCPEAMDVCDMGTGPGQKGRMPRFIDLSNSLWLCLSLLRRPPSGVAGAVDATADPLWRRSV